MNYEVSGRRRHGKIGRWHAYHHRAHLRMNIAENIRDTWSIEMYISAGAALVEAQIESLTVKAREDIVKEWVEVRKGHDTTNLYHQYVWYKLLILLRQLKAALRRPRRS